MRGTLYAISVILLSAGLADSGRSAPRSLISKKTAAAIGLTHPHAAQGAQARSTPPNSTASTAKTGNFQKPEPGEPRTAVNGPIVNSRSLSYPGLRPPAVAAPIQAPGLHAAELQRTQAAIQRMGAVPSIKASGLPPAQQPQPGPFRNATLMSINTPHHSAPRLTPLGGLAANGNIGALDGTSFQPKRR